MIQTLCTYLREQEVLQAISPRDRMFQGNKAHYFGVGRSSLLSIMVPLAARLAYSGGDADIRSILDFGCGHGRVARFLRAAFSQAEIVVTDYNEDGVQWCVSNLDCRAMGDLAQCDSSFDLIWVGSVITHLPEKNSISLLQGLLRALRPNGVLVVTSHGRFPIRTLDRYASDIQDGDSRKPYNLSRDAAREIVAGYRASGYGYYDYPEQQDYGISAISQSWFSEHVLGDDKVLQVSFQELGWDFHQDVYAFMRRDMSHLGRGIYYI